MIDCGPTGCALAAPPPIDGKDIVAETGAEKRTISHDAKRRPLQARVGRVNGTASFVSNIISEYDDLRIRNTQLFFS